MKNKKQLIKGLAFITVGIVLLILVIFLEKRRESALDTKEIIAYANNKVSELKSSEVLSTMDKTSIIIFNDDSLYSKTSIQLLEKLNKEYENIQVYSYDLSTEEADIVLENNKIIVKKDSTVLYKSLLKKFGEFSEVYAIELDNGELINTGYKKIVLPFTVFINKGKIIYTHFVSEEFFSSYTEKDLEKIYRTGAEMLIKKGI
ncbi:MAG: hypothetical protein RSB41_00700 [Bacilli bacterium]